MRQSLSSAFLKPCKQNCVPAGLHLALVENRSISRVNVPERQKGRQTPLSATFKTAVRSIPAGMKNTAVFLSVFFVWIQMFLFPLFHKCIGKPENFGGDLLPLFL